MPKPFSVLAHKTTLPDVEAQSEIGPLWLSPIDEDNVLVDANKHCLSPKNGDLSAAPNVDCRFVRVVHRGKNYDLALNIFLRRTEGKFRIYAPINHLYICLRETRQAAPVGLKKHVMELVESSVNQWASKNEKTLKTAGEINRNNQARETVETIIKYEERLLSLYKKVEPLFSEGTPEADRVKQMLEALGEDPRGSKESEAE